MGACELCVFFAWWEIEERNRDMSQREIFHFPVSFSCQSHVCLSIRWMMFNLMTLHALVC